MNDRQIRVTTVVAGAMWILGSAIVATGVLTKVYGLPAVGLLLAGGGGVLNIRGFVLRMEERVRDAFQLGRDYERGLMKRAQVRSLH